MFLACPWHACAFPRPLPVVCGVVLGNDLRGRCLFSPLSLPFMFLAYLWHAWCLTLSASQSTATAKSGVRHFVCVRVSCLNLAAELSAWENQVRVPKGGAGRGRRKVGRREARQMG